MGPKDAPLLPLSNQKYAEYMWSEKGIKKITALYARSLAVSEYKVFDHPNFEVFASGTMSSPFAPCEILDDPDLRVRFRRRELVGLGPGLIWSRPANLPANKEVYYLWPSPNASVRRCGIPV